ncbi:MAG: hypothetical protein ISR69_07945 [Gammaproteobacteria bacterium]|nr:hypothetical protein [Gammaproteobacteria bacterium]
MGSLVIKLNGEIQSSNFHEWKNELIEQIDSTQLDLLTDHDFANAELNVKTFKIAEKTLKSAKQVAIKQASDIQELFEAIDQVTEQTRQARLTLERQIKKRKAELKEGIALEGVNTMLKELSQQSDDFNLTDNSFFLDKDMFLSRISGTRGVSGARKAVELLCLQLKDEVYKKAMRIRENSIILDTISIEYSSLFQDRSYLIALESHDLNKEIDHRIDTHVTNQKLINHKIMVKSLHPLGGSGSDNVPIKGEPSLDNLAIMGIIETESIITALVNSSKDEKIIRALMTCLRLLKDESKRLNGE